MRTYNVTVSGTFVHSDDKQTEQQINERFSVPVTDGFLSIVNHLQSELPEYGEFRELAVTLTAAGDLVGLD